MAPVLHPEPPDTDKRFRTFYNYFAAWRMLFESRYGEHPNCPMEVMVEHPGFKTTSRQVSQVSRLVSCLRNAWSTETLLNMPLSSTIDRSLARYACAWAPVQAYYAVYSAMMALFDISGQKAEKHRAALNQISSLVDGAEWVPDVIRFSCIGHEDLNNLEFRGIPSCASYPMSNLRFPVNEDEALSLVMTCLKTTRRERFDEQAEKEREEKRKKGKRPRLSRQERLSVDQRIQPTTLFDFLYRMRIRCNYEEVDSFILGVASDDQSSQFLGHLVVVVGHVLAFLETAIWAKVGANSMKSIVSSYIHATDVGELVVPVSLRWRVL